MSQSKVNQSKVFLIGWDAADWKVIYGLMDDGRMPTVKRLVDNGVMGNLATLSPVLSPMLWTSIATGKRPFKHGIYGFSEPTPDGKSVQPMTNVSRKCKAVWNILNQHDKKSLVLGLVAQSSGRTDRRRDGLRLSLQSPQEAGSAVEPDEESHSSGTNYLMN